jgi:excisionase family DNA binding protein
MSSELIPLKEAAAKLGVTEEKLLEMRTNKQIFGVRDGSSWKFKQSELDRVAEDLGLGAGQISDVDTPIENASDSMDLLDASDDLLLTDDSGSGALSGASLLDDSGELSLEEDAPKRPDDTDKMSGKKESNDLDLMDDDLFESDELNLQDSAGLDGSDLSSDFVDSSDVVVDDSDSDGSGSEGLMLDEEDLVVSDQGVEDDDFELSDSSILSLDDSGEPDDFDLEPVNESLDDQSSSSQVIALEDSDLVDDSHPTMMAGQSGDLLSSDEFGGGGAMPLESFSEAAATSAVSTGAGMAMVPAEPPYTALQILSLGSTLLFTGGLAILSLNLAQNMWQPSDSGFTGTIANLLVDLMQFGD